MAETLYVRDKNDVVNFEVDKFLDKAKKYITLLELKAEGKVLLPKDEAFFSEIVGRLLEWCKDADAWNIIQNTLKDRIEEFLVYYDQKDIAEFFNPAISEIKKDRKNFMHNLDGERKTFVRSYDALVCTLRFFTILQEKGLKVNKDLTVDSKYLQNYNIKWFTEALPTTIKALNTMGIETIEKQDEMTY